MTLKDAVEAAGPAIMGDGVCGDPSEGWAGWPRFTTSARASPITSISASQDAALVGRNSKEEAYYFPEGVDLGPHPETFFGVHPYIVERARQSTSCCPTWWSGRMT